MVEMVKSKMDRATAIKWGVTILLPVLVYLIPTNEVYTPVMQTFFVSTMFWLCIIAFELFDIIVPAIAMPATWVLLGVTTMNVAFSGLTASVVYTVLGSYVFAYALQEIGLLQRIAFAILSKTGETFRGIMIGIFVVGCVLSLITFGQGYIIMAALCYGMCVALNLKPGRTSAAIFLAGILGSVSARCWIYAPTTLAIPIAQAQVVVGPDFDITFFQSFWHNWPVGLACFICLIFVAKIYNPKESINGKAYFQEQLADLGELSVKEKKAIVITIILLAYLLIGPLLNWDTNWAFIFIPWLMYAPIINVATVEGSITKVNYRMIFFISACMGMGTVANTLGIGQIIAQTVTPWFQGKSVFAVFAAEYGLCFGANFVLTPSSIWSLMTGPMCQIALSLGMDPRPFVYAIIHSCEAVIFPYEYVPYLIMYSFGMMSMKEFIKLNGIRCLFYFGGFMLLVVPWWFLVGVIAPL